MSISLWINLEIGTKRETEESYAKQRPHGGRRTKAKFVLSEDTSTE